MFPQRGEPDTDREYRHPRIRSTEKPPKRESTGKSGRDSSESSIPRNPRNEAGILGSSDPWDLLPPLQEIIDGVNNFTRHYFQLGFIPKQLFPARLRQDHRAISPFLLLSILSISARFTDSLTTRYGAGLKAVDLFMERAASLGSRELYEPPTLERCQAFYLLSIAQQGSGWKTASHVWEPTSHKHCS